MRRTAAAVVVALAVVVGVPGTASAALGVGGNDTGITGALVGCINWWLPPIGYSCKPRWVGPHGDLVSRPGGDHQARVVLRSIGGRL